jgi:CDP-diacylglycerol---serine O-phosphatidyltransferase
MSAPNPLPGLSLPQILRPKLLARRSFSLRQILPSVLTIMALCSGLTAIRFATEEKWQLVILAMLAAAACDTLDGRIARMLKTTSNFGAQLDSLSDVIAFGVAPAMILYFWALEGIGRLGWVAVIFFVACAAIRLARFNLDIGDGAKPAYKANYFTGVPTPCATGLVLAPLLLSFEFGNFGQEYPKLLAFWLLVVGFLMVSQLPTFSFKRVRIESADVPMVLTAVAAAMGAILIEPWLTLASFAGIYLLLLPISYERHHRQAAAHIRAVVADIPKP